VIFGKLGQRAYTLGQEVLPMPTRNVNLPDKLDQFITAKVASGDYANASEVMRAALRLMERDEREYEEKLAALRAAIAEGDASPDAQGDVFAEIREKYGLPQREAEHA
jgi:antitoxin ParD1/3/4